jgi:HlyD family secretion protein
MLLGLALWQTIPKGFKVSRQDLQIAAVTTGQFRDELLVRATAAPLSSVVLDATEGGRVEYVAVRDGAVVKQGEVLFRLSNPQRQQEVLARAADVAQQVANVATLRAALEVGRAEYRRRISVLEYELIRAKKEHTRNGRLGEQSFISAAVLQESEDRVQQQETLLAQARTDAAAEEAIRQRAIADLDRAVRGLNDGLVLVRAVEDALTLRAPTEGRLTGFRLDVGESVKPGDRLGRIDSPGSFKLLAQVDEFYLHRTTPGLKGQVEVGSRVRTVVLSRVNPQVKDRRFDIELDFADGPKAAELQPGQSIDTRISLGAPSVARLVADGAFFTDTGGTWVFVLTTDGRAAERRAVKLGRRGGGQIEVLSGLDEGEQIVTSSYTDFRDAPRLRIEP